MIAKYEFRNENGQLHKTDGPAIEYDGDKFWYQNGNLHREDGPAIEYAEGTKKWVQNHLLHRTDGPAVELPDGTKFYWVYGNELTEAEFYLYKFVNKL